MSQDASRSDPELVAAYQSGDESAATELVHRHGRALARYLFGVGAAAAELDDLVQETFFKAFRALGGWRGEATFRSWLFRIGGNLRKDWYRKQRGRVVIPLEDQDLPAASDPEGEAGAVELERQLLQGLARLPRLQREVFLLRAQQGLPYEEICATLGTTPGAARVHYHHAVRRLKEMIR